MYIRKKYAENSRIKRPNKKLKSYDTIFSTRYGIYIKLIIMWSIFFLVDYLMDLRVEIFWSCWMMCRSINEAYKYQGLVFTLFFTLTVITSDLICYLLIPTKWLFFLGCTYVWIQLMGIADRSISALTVGSCVFYVYIEFTFRLRQVSKNLSFTLNICRPFAAHCIGYPVVTMCFELKNYVSHKFRIRRQNDVRRVNQFYFELIEKAIPEDLRQFSYNTENDTGSWQESIENSSTSSTSKPEKKKCIVSDKIKSNKWNNMAEVPDVVQSQSPNNLSSNITAFLNDLPYQDNNQENTFHDTDGHDNDDPSISQKRIKRKSITTLPKGLCPNNDIQSISLPDMSKTSKEDTSVKFDTQMKKIKTELHSVKKTECDLKTQLHQLQQLENQTKTELKTVKTEVQMTQSKLLQTQQRLSSEKHLSQQFEKKLVEEKKVRQQLQQQLDQERRCRAEDGELRSRAIQAVASAAARSAECGDGCKKQRRDMETEINVLRRETRLQEDRITQLSRQVMEWPALARIADDHRDLAVRISTVKDENLHLTEQLRELNKMKQELLTSYHCSQLEIKELDFVLKKKNYQIFELQSKLQSLVPINDYTSYGIEPTTITQHNYQSYSPTNFTHHTTCSSGRHSSNNSPLYMPYSNNGNNNHSP